MRNLNSRPRSTTGATLSLVIVSCMMVLLIGALMFWGARLIGENFLLNNASDAGIKNVAKLALVEPAVSLTDPTLAVNDSDGNACPYNDFAVFSDQKDGNGNPCIDLAVYNQALGWAVMAKVNAMAEGTQAACAHADAITYAVNQIGAALAKKFVAVSGGQGVFDQIFLNMANNNPLNMLNNKSSGANLLGNIATGGSYGPTNIAFDMSTFPTTISIVYNPQSGYDPKLGPNHIYGAIAVGPWLSCPGGQMQLEIPVYDKPGSPNFDASADPNWQGPLKYMAGYTFLCLPSIDGQYSASDNGAYFTSGGIPLFPQLNPHLVDAQRLKEDPNDAYQLNSNGTITGGYMIPNTFIAQSSANGPAGSSGTKGSVIPNGNNSNSNNNSNNNNNGSNGPKNTVNGVASFANSASNAQVYSLSCAVAAGAQSHIVCKPDGYVRVVNGSSMPSIGDTDDHSMISVADPLSYNCSDSLFNNEAFSKNSKIYLATPLPVSNGTVDLTHVIWATNDSGKAALDSWVKFDTTIDPTVPDAAAETVNALNLYIANDPLSNGGGTTSSVALATKPSTAVSGINEGVTNSHTSVLSDVAGKITGYVAIADVTYDGSPLTSTDGSTYNHEIIVQILPGLSTALGHDYKMLVSTGGLKNFSGYDLVTWLKTEIQKAYKVHYFEGSYNITVKANDSTGTYIQSGLLVTAFYNDKGKRIHYASPNNFYHCKAPQGLSQAEKALKDSEQEFPGINFSSGTVNQYINEVDEIITKNGNRPYEAGQSTKNDLFNRMLISLRQINPDWTIDDLNNALNNSSASLALNQALYLHADANNHLVLDNKINDAGDAPDGTGSLTNNITFGTTADEAVILDWSILNTALDGSPTALKGDANMELTPWRTIEDSKGKNHTYENPNGNLFSCQFFSAFVPCTGYHGLMGELVFGERMAPLNFKVKKPN